jgi:tetratricopeptide (TPR) repeat protein
MTPRCHSIAGRRRIRAASTVLTIAVILCTCLGARAAITRYSFDQEEVRVMRTRDPRATETFEKGEALAKAGQLEAALAAFQEAGAALPDNSLPRRRVCEALTALGRTKDVPSDCFKAVQMSRTNLSIRALIRAMVAGPQAPTMERLAQAVSFITLERGRAPNHMALSSALCDIADRIGDGVMLQHCAEELVLLAPNAPETRHALARLDSRCPPARFWTGWLAIIAAAFATFAHALRRRLSRTARKRLPPAVVAAALGILALGPVHLAAADVKPKPGAPLSTWSIDDADPESKIPSEADRNKDPLNFGYWLQDMIQKGEVASKRGDHQMALKYFRALVQAVPDRGGGYAKACEEYEALGDREHAIASCGAVLLLEGVTLDDYAHYVRLVLGKAGALTKEDVKKVDGVIDHLGADPAAHPLADLLECEFGTRISDVEKLQKCVSNLSTIAPDDLKTIEYQWVLALHKNNFADARQAIVRARQAGVTGKDAANMEAATAAKERSHTWILRLICISLGLLAAGLAFAARYFARRRPPAAPSLPPGPSEPAFAESS